MRTDPGSMAGSFSLSVNVNEKREGFFILQPIGSINTITSPILQNEIEQIYESKPVPQMLSVRTQRLKKQLSHIRRIAR